MTLRMYANRKQLPLDDVIVTLSLGRHYVDDCADCADCDERERRLEVRSRRIEPKGELTPEQRERLLEIANKCPVHWTLESTLVVRTELAKN